MTKPIMLSCRDVMDEIFESFGDDVLPWAQRFRINFHLFFCPRCTAELRKLEIFNEMMRSDFFPPAPYFEEEIMKQLAGEFSYDEISEQISKDLLHEVPGGFSFRSWVIIGLIILLSLATSFFGTDFIKAASNLESSFMLPLGITVGIVLTGYGAFFIASHLKELSEHFKILR